MIVKSFNFSKAGSPESETEDAVSYNIETKRFSVCDGAGDSIFSPLWASCLSSQFTDNDFDLSITADMEKYISGCRMKWYESIDWENLRWNVKKKAVFGSYSTFLAASFVEDDVTYARVWARGDTCLFLYKENSMDAFPIKDIKELGHEAFQHPKRGRYYGEKLDNFSALIIFLSLSALAVNPALWKYNEGDPDKLIFDPADFQNPAKSPVFKELMKLGGYISNVTMMLQDYLKHDVDWDGMNIDKIIKMK